MDRALWGQIDDTFKIEQGYEVEDIKESLEMAKATLDDLIETDKFNIHYPGTYCAAINAKECIIRALDNLELEEIQ